VRLTRVLQPRVKVVGESGKLSAAGQSAAGLWGYSHGSAPAAPCPGVARVVGVSCMSAAHRAFFGVNARGSGPECGQLRGPGSQVKLSGPQKERPGSAPAPTPDLCAGRPAPPGIPIMHDPELARAHIPASSNRPPAPPAATPARWWSRPAPHPAYGPAYAPGLVPPGALPGILAPKTSGQPRAEYLTRGMTAACPGRPGRWPGRVALPPVAEG